MSLYILKSWETILSESSDAAGHAHKKTDPNNWVCFLKTGNVLLSQAASHQVSSALRSLTTVFEMGTGVTSSLLSPDFLLVKFTCRFVAAHSLRYSHTLVCSVPRSSRALRNANFPSQFFQVVPWKLNKSIKLALENHWSSFRPISIGQLNVSPHLHLRPINVIVSHGSYHFWRKSILVGGFALRCFQRLSRP